MEANLNINTNIPLDTILFVTKGREIYPIGVDYGAKCIIQFRTKNYLVFKVPSHNYWAGIGLTGSAKTTYYIVKIEKWPEEESSNKYGGSRGHGTIVITAEPGSYWRKFLGWALEYTSNN